MQHLHYILFILLLVSSIESIQDPQQGQHYDTAVCSRWTVNHSFQTMNVIMLHYAVTVTDLLSTNFRWLMQIQKTHECHPLPRYHTRGNLVHNKHNIVSVDTALGDTPTQPPK
jgi:hypothetical protein